MTMTPENLSRSDFPTTLATPAPAHIRTLRQHLALTQVEFGALVRSSGRAAQEWEAGRRSGRRGAARCRSACGSSR